MAILPILEIPNPLLRRRAKKVRSLSNKTISLAHDMVETMREAGGVGLAANQVGVLQRIIVIQLPEALDSNFKTIKFKADNLLSQALEHEVDHLNGILYTDHLVEHESLYKIEEQKPTETLSEDDLDTSSSFTIK